MGAPPGPVFASHPSDIPVSPTNNGTSDQSEQGSARRFSVSSVDTLTVGYTPSRASTIGNIMDASSMKMEVNPAPLSAKHSTKRKASQLLKLRRVQLLHAGIKSGIFVFDSPELYFFLRDTR